MSRAACLLVLLLALAGCGGGGEEGTALLFVTRDKGRTLLLEAEVGAGQTLLRALRAEAEVETRFGGRFVQSIEGVSGSLTEQRDWFWFLNGYEGDRSAAEYRLRDGDVAWWDFRRWRREGEARVVVGLFPEPFVHGYAGRVRPAAVRFERGLDERARELADRVGAESVEPLGAPVAAGSNVLEVRSGPERLTGELRSPSGSAGDPVRFVIAGDPRHALRYVVP